MGFLTNVRAAREKARTNAQELRLALARVEDLLADPLSPEFPAGVQALEVRSAVLLASLREVWRLRDTPGEPTPGAGS